jgi:hypothetical protein
LTFIGNYTMVLKQIIILFTERTCFIKFIHISASQSEHCIAHGLS